LAYYVTHHAVESNRRDEQGEHGERQDYGGSEPRLSGGVGDEVLHGRDVVDWHPAIDLRHSLAQQGYHAQGVNGCA